MKFALSKEHRYFFQEKGYIQFEDFLPKERLESLIQTLEGAISKLKIGTSPIQQYELGWDLWRRDEEVQKWAAFHRFPELLADLTRMTTLRLGYDQFIPSISSNQISDTIEKKFDKPSSLESTSCLKGIVGAVIVALDSTYDEELPIEAGVDPFPYKEGSISIVGPSTLIDWRSLLKHHDQRFYMIVYADKKAIYQLEPVDSHTHEWKHLGYIFNEKLVEKFHPTVFK